MGQQTFSVEGAGKTFGQPAEIATIEVLQSTSAPAGAPAIDGGGGNAWGGREHGEGNDQTQADQPAPARKCHTHPHPLVTRAREGGRRALGAAEATLGVLLTAAGVTLAVLTLGLWRAIVPDSIEPLPTRKVRRRSFTGTGMHRPRPRTPASLHAQNSKGAHGVHPPETPQPSAAAGSAVVVTAAASPTTGKDWSTDFVHGSAHEGSNS